MRYFFGILASFYLLSGCTKNNPDPAWLEVSEWTLLKNMDLGNNQGELSHNFSDAWVYVNDKVIGVFEMPFKIPVLQSGICNIKLYPTVRNNGISATKKIYPFVDYYEITAELVKNQILKINPVTKYKSNTQFWIEDFEDATIKINTDPASKKTMSVGNDPALMKWNRYGYVSLNELDANWIAYTSEALNLPKGKEVYLELDYYNTNALVTGVIAISSATEYKNNPYIQLNSQVSSDVRWKKIYIDMKEIISNSSNANSFLMSFQASLDAGDSDGLIVLDNIKVVYF
jgi:hypothetical protein